MTPTGKLFIVATPIGNLGDITIRAIETLKAVDLILAEDTRHATILLQHYQISTPVHSFHAHNEQKKSETYLTMLQSGKQIALISDAGTPLINDPGFPLVQQARIRQIEVVPIPGPSAVICALSAAGIPTFQFSYYGFPPAKSKPRQQLFESLKNMPQTLVFYESTHRLKESLKDLQTIFGEHRPIVLAKELTKSFEHFEFNTIDNVIAWLEADLQRYKGEFVLMIPPSEKPNEETYNHEEVLKILLEYLKPKQAALATQRITGESKNYLYQLAIKLQKNE